jgi:predicted metalloendopeptidase
MRHLSLLLLAGAGLAAACAESTPPAATPTTPTSAIVHVPSTAPKADKPALTLAQTGIVADWMDPSADPCQDYAAYACGGFVKRSVIPSDRAEWSVSAQVMDENEAFLHETLEKAKAAPSADPAVQKIGDYYAACTDESSVEKAGIAPIKPLLDQVATVKDARSLALAVANLHASHVTALFEVGSMQDFKDATQVIAGFDQDRLGLPDRDYYLKDEGNMKDVRAFYAGHVERMFGLLGEKPAAAKVAAKDVLRIETKLAKASQDKVERRDPHNVYHRVDREGLPAIAKTFPWDDYFKTLGFSDLREISVNDPRYYTAVDALMHEERPAAWRNYLTWRVVREEAKRMSKPFQAEAFALREKITGQKELEPRWKTCVRAVDHQLGELLGQAYVSARFAGDSRDRARELVKSFHEAMRTDLGQLGWIDDTTRAAALAKLDSVNDKVGYPDKWRAYDFTVSRTDFLGNALRSDAFEMKRDLNKVGKPVDKTEWDMSPPTVNAYYNPLLNEIVLPAGQLQPPFFSHDSYAPVNIGDIGANTIGHELTHAFDDEGSQFDGAGNLRDWWTKETKAKFDQATKCVQDQYSSYEAVPGVKLNGALSSGENIADIGGVKLGVAALVAWQSAHPEERRTVEGFSDEQLFFLGYAQGWCTKETPELTEMRAHSNEHSPPRWRINGPMADTAAFAQAYSCKPGTPMNTGNACSVW